VVLSLNRESSGADVFRGDRYGKLEVPFGHHWSVGTHVRDVSMAEMQQAMRKGSAQSFPGHRLPPV